MALEEASKSRLSGCFGLARVWAAPRDGALRSGAEPLWERRREHLCMQIFWEGRRQEHKETKVQNKGRCWKMIDLS